MWRSKLSRGHTIFAGLLDRLASDDSTLCFWLHDWGYCHIAKSIWDLSDASPMVLCYGKESKHLSCLKSNVLDVCASDLREAAPVSLFQCQRFSSTSYIRRKSAGNQYSTEAASVLVQSQFGFGGF